MIMQRLRRSPFLIRLFNWEYWSFNMVYGWIMPVWFILAARARSFFFFSTANPSIEYGGFLMESKKKIYDLLNPAVYPRTLYFAAGTPTALVKEAIAQEKMQFPLIAKPDIGGQGRGVKLLYAPADIDNYACTQVDFLLQTYIPYPNEVGIFYYRFPGADKGHISGIVEKKMLAVTGDGTASIRTLLLRNPRYVLQMPALEQQYGSTLEEILPEGAYRELVPYGNHARGALFTDSTHLVNPSLEAMMDKLCKSIPGFHYGRLDIRYKDWDSLSRGESFAVIELNGAGSEPTHMYDPKHSLFFAWKEIIRHWVILWKISRANHAKGNAYLTRKEGLQMFRDNKQFMKKLKAIGV